MPNAVLGLRELIGYVVPGLLCLLIFAVAFPDSVEVLDPLDTGPARLLVVFGLAYAMGHLVHINLNLLLWLWKRNRRIFRFLGDDLRMLDSAEYRNLGKNYVAALEERVTRIYPFLSTPMNKSTQAHAFLLVEQWVYVKGGNATADARRFASIYNMWASLGGAMIVGALLFLARAFSTPFLSLQQQEQVLWFSLFGIGWIYSAWRFARTYNQWVRQVYRLFLALERNPDLTQEESDSDR